MESKKRRILQLSFFDTGGASVSAKRVSDAVNETEFTSVHSSIYSATNVSTPFEFRIGSKLDRLIQSREQYSNGVSIFKSLGIENKILKNIIKNNPIELINYHYMPAFANFNLDNTLDLPTVVTLKDMNLLTGGCHHSRECTKFHNACLNCPQTKKIVARIPRLSQISKQRSLANQNSLTLVTPSKWLANEVKKSALVRNFNVTVIPNPLPRDQSRHPEQSFLREKFGIKQDNIVIALLGSNYEAAKNPLGALSSIAEAQRLRGELNISVIPIGTNFKQAPLEQFGFNKSNLSQYEVEQSLCAADFFVYCSLAETFGNILIESQAVGTPVVAWDVGGIAETIKDGFTGVIAEANTTDLTKKILSMLDFPDWRRKLKANCTIKNLSEFTQLTVGNQYSEVYKYSIERHRDASKHNS